MPSSDAQTSLEAPQRVRDDLRGAASLGALLATAADAACREAGFERGVVLSVDGRLLSAAETDALKSAPGDRLRRSLLSTPVLLETGTEEHALVRRPRASRRRQPRLESALAPAAGLEAFVLAPVVPESAAVALLVLDRPGPAPTGPDGALVEAMAMVLALELALLVHRTRVDELIAEVRQFSGMLVAVGREIHQATVTLPHDRGLGMAFRRADGLGAGRASASMLSPAETRIAALIADGRSNREIAEALVLSPETVKSHVARILRKLGAANRTEAASLYLRQGS